MFPIGINLLSNNFSSLIFLWTLSQEAMRTIKKSLNRYDYKSTICRAQCVCSTQFTGTIPSGELPIYCLHLTVLQNRCESSFMLAHLNASPSRVQQGRYLITTSCDAGGVDTLYHVTFGCNYFSKPRNLFILLLKKKKKKIT